MKEVAKGPARAILARVAINFVVPNAEIPARMWKHLFVSIILQLCNILSVLWVYQWPTFSDVIVSVGLLHFTVESLTVHLTNQN